MITEIMRYVITHMQLIHQKLRISFWNMLMFVHHENNLTCKGILFF